MDFFWGRVPIPEYFQRKTQVKWHPRGRLGKSMKDAVENTLRNSSCLQWVAGPYGILTLDVTGAPATRGVKLSGVQGCQNELTSLLTALSSLMLSRKAPWHLPATSLLCRTHGRIQANFWACAHSLKLTYALQHTRVNTWLIYNKDGHTSTNAVNGNYEILLQLECLASAMKHLHSLRWNED